MTDKRAKALKIAAQVSEPAPEIVPSDVLEQRAELVRALVEGNFGSVLGRDLSRSCPSKVGD